MSKTLYDKIWNEHLVHEQIDGTSLLFVDRHLIHEVTSPQAFEGLRNTNRKVRQPNLTLAVVDHNIPTTDRSKGIDDEESRIQVETLEKNCKDFGIKLFGMTDKRQGIVHIVGPEQGFTQPGTVIVCGDSHTATHGAFGSLAFGIGTSEVEHVLATQTLVQKKAKNFRINVNGKLALGVTSKDVILQIIGKIGTAGGTGSVIEYAGTLISDLSVEQRMTICNMTIEGGARAGLIQPDEKIFNYLKGKPMSPKNENWDKALNYWSNLKTDNDAEFDKDVKLPKINQHQNGDRFTRPNLCGMVFRHPKASWSSRNKSHLPIFFNAITPVEMSRCVPYIDIKIVTRQYGANKKIGDLSQVKFMRFTRKNGKDNEYVLDDAVGFGSANPDLLTCTSGKEADVVKDFLALATGNQVNTAPVPVFDAVNNTFPIANITGIQIRRHTTTATVTSDA